MFSALQRTSGPVTDVENSVPTSNRCIIGDDIHPQTGTKLTKKRGSKFGAQLWRHLTPSRTNRKYRCTTTVHPVYNFWKKILENLLPVGLLVRTILFIQSRF